MSLPYDVIQEAPSLLPPSPHSHTPTLSQTTGDVADHSITNQLMDVIWSFGQVYPDYFHTPASGIEAGTAQNMRFYQPDEIKYHGGHNRGRSTINFFGKCVCVHVCVCAYMSVHVHSFIYVCMYVCVCACVFAYMRTCVHGWGGWRLDGGAHHENFSQFLAHRC